MDFQDSGAQLRDPEATWVEEDEEEIAEGMVRKNLAAAPVGAAMRCGLKGKHLAAGVVERAEEVAAERFAEPEMIILFDFVCLRSPENSELWLS